MCLYIYLVYILVLLLSDFENINLFIFLHNVAIIVK